MDCLSVRDLAWCVPHVALPQDVRERVKEVKAGLQETGLFFS